jgi:AcrR family transcriptional regulator
MAKTQEPRPQRNFRGLSPNERVDQRRKQLLDAGLECFGTRGFHGTGVREICAQAGLTERYFYESFKNREALFQAVFEHVSQQVLEAIVQALQKAGREPSELARAALRPMLESYRADPRLARILLMEVLSAGAREASLVTSEKFAALIAGLIAALDPELGSRGYDAKTIADGLYGSTVYIAMRWTESGFAEPVDEVLDHCVIFYEALTTHLTGRTRMRATQLRKPSTRPPVARTPPQPARPRRRS